MPDTLLIALDSFRIYLGYVSVLIGALTACAGAIGILRFPDVYTRMHAASVTDTAAALLTLSGMALIAGWSIVSIKLALIVLFLFITGPTATHAIANAALGSGLVPISGRWQGHPLHPASDKPEA